MAPDGSHFLGADGTVPPLVSLPELLAVAQSVDTYDDPHAAFKMLLDTGSTGLGGARPKASVRLPDGALALAKFAHAHDEWDVMAWEATALTLLSRMGVQTPQFRLQRVGGASVVVLRRFDRDKRGRRVRYISAMTATSQTDGQRGDYLDVADAMRDLSQDLAADYADLFRRVVASVALGNTDDHLRNHGFVGHGHAWRLSPAFDVNPNPELGRPRATSIAGCETFPGEVEALPTFAAELGLDSHEALGVVRSVIDAVHEWRRVASKCGVSARDQELMGDSLAARSAALEALLR